MSPNAPQNRSYDQFQQMNRVVQNVAKTSTFVPIDRLYEVAQQLATLEISQERLVDSCVSLLDCGAPDLVSRRYGSLAGPPPPAYGPHTGRDKTEKSYCEVVSVPTSAHVAQIVGKQGSKIKLLRAKSKTYIQTPVNGEEPVFIITGRREDVLKVKSEILSASDHFTAISEERKQKFRQNCNIPGGVSLNLKVPSFLIGLIVGRNGQTIRNFQLTTQTSIETPKTEQQSFKISGLQENVIKVKDQIIEHIRCKTQRPLDIAVNSSGDISVNILQ